MWSLSVTFKAISLFNFDEISCDQTIRHDERAVRCGEEIWTNGSKSIRKKSAQNIAEINRSKKWQWNQMTYTKCLFIEFLAGVVVVVINIRSIWYRRDVWLVWIVCVYMHIWSVRAQCAYNINYARKKGALISYELLQIDLTNRLACWEKKKYRIFGDSFFFNAIFIITKQIVYVILLL